MIIGFSNGAFYRKYNNELDRFSDEYIKLYQSDNANAIELVVLDESVLDYIINTENMDLSYFKNISIHAPSLIYSDINITRNILSKLEQITQKFKIKNVLFHPDLVSDRDLLAKYQNIPISIENMDNNKSFGRTVEDIQLILDKYDFKLTLDLQHCYVNDPTMQLASDFQTVFKDKIVEYHISGYDPDLLHYPLFKTKQDQIISSLQYQNIPIIIESTFDQIGEQKVEIEYIINRLK